MEKQYIHFINEGNKQSLNKPDNTSRLYYSELHEWFTNNAFRNFSIKLVIEGAIYYRCSRREYIVRPNQFLIASRQDGVKAYFDSPLPVKSICIDIAPASIAEAFNILCNRRELDLDNHFAGYFEHPHFFEQVYNLNRSLCSCILQHLTRSLEYLKPNHTGYINEEWFLQLAEMIILQEKKNYLSLNKLNARKTNTRKEIYRRLLQGKEYMDAFFAENPSIQQVARQCHLSTFHFFRSFREAFAVSPYQYMLQKRLQMSAPLLLQPFSTLEDIAITCGFSDAVTFSKAFKRFFGIAPSAYARDRKLKNDQAYSSSRCAITASR